MYLVNNLVIIFKKHIKLQNIFKSTSNLSLDDCLKTEADISGLSWLKITDSLRFTN